MQVTDRATSERVPHLWGKWGKPDRAAYSVSAVAVGIERIRPVPHHALLALAGARRSSARYQTAA